MHAAAGGVGLILCQWGQALGATVIGTAGSPKRRARPRTRRRAQDPLPVRGFRGARVKEITGRRACDVVYDGVGKATFPGSLDCLRPLGTFVSFGAASGQVEAFNIDLLARKARFSRRGRRFSPTRPTPPR